MRATRTTRRRGSSSSTTRKSVSISTAYFLEQMAMIDWNDFIVVEQIDFFDEDKHEKVIEKGTQRFDKIDFATLEPSISVQSQVSTLMNQPEMRVLNQPTSYTLASTQPKKEPEQPPVGENVQIVKGYVRPTKSVE